MTPLEAIVRVQTGSRQEVMVLGTEPCLLILSFLIIVSIYLTALVMCNPSSPSLDSA